MNKQQTDDVEQANAIILNKLRKLNSGITFKTAKDPEASPASESSNYKESQQKLESAESLQNPGAIETPDEEWLKEWKSKRSSICVVSNKSTTSVENPPIQEKKAKVYTCNFCKSSFEAQSSLIFHIPKCSQAPGNSEPASECSQSESKPNSALERLLGSVSISKKLSVPKGISITQASDKSDSEYRRSNPSSPSQPEKREESPLPASRPATPQPTVTEKKLKVVKRSQKSRSSTPELGNQSLLEQDSQSKTTPSLKQKNENKVLQYPTPEAPPVSSTPETPPPPASSSLVAPANFGTARRKQPVKQQKKKFKAAPTASETTVTENKNPPIVDALDANKSPKRPKSDGEDFEGFSDPEFVPKPKSARSAKGASKSIARKSARKRTKKRVVVDFVPDYSSSSNSPTAYAAAVLEKLPYGKNEDPTFSPPRVDGVGLDHSKNYQFRRERRASDARACIRCGISDLGTPKDFEFHHLQHIIDKKLYVSLAPLPIKSESIKETRTLLEHSIVHQQSFSPQLTKTESPESLDGEDQSSQGSIAESKTNSEETLPPPFSPNADPSSPLEPKEDPELHLGETVLEEASNKAPDPPLKLTLKISQSSDGKNKKTVSIVHKDSSSVSDGSASDSEMNTAWNAHSSVETPLDPPSEQPKDENPPPSAAVTASNQDPLLTAVDTPASELKSQSIPQDNTMTNSGEVTNVPNITDGGTGTNLTDIGNSYQSANAPQNPSYEPQFESFTGDWMQDYDSGNRIAAAMAGAATQSSVTQPPPQTNDAGLFSQAVLGSSPTYNQLPQPNVSQGSFEEFCLNDQYNPMSNNVGNIVQSQQVYNPVTSQYQYSNVPTTPMHPTNEVNMNSPLQQNTIDNGTQNPYSRLPNSTSPAGHLPSQSPEFQVPGYPNQGQQATPPVASGQTPPLPAQPSPSQSSEAATDTNVPRLTIANNLMAQSPVPAPPDNGLPAFNPQWTAPPNIPNLAPPTFPQPSQPMAPPPRRGMPVGYRPSPRPRIRGRPPVIDQLARPFRPGPMPFRPRGPTNQRGYKQFSGQRYPQPQTAKRSANSANLSPGKASKREDINVPFRQKDTDCQIIAVANRNEGMPIIANIQGGTKDNRPAKAPATDSTIHLSDSITLSVRPNNSQSPHRGEKEQSGGVANLLAARGITVTPAAGEKDGSSESNRSERRLPSASELNLSSAISVHPPTSRDREGFAVPLPPSNKSSPSPVERPPRPPTVDLTRDPNRDTRASCSQCDKIFPTEALLADHAKVHQQQAQSRMPFKCHLCSAGYSSRKGQQQHYQQFHQLHLSAGDLGIPIVDLRNPSNIQKMQRLGIRAFLPLNNLQNRGAGGVVGIPILSLENLNSTSISSLQQWGINDVLSLGPPKTINHPR